mgnify:CR=1 FL=1
MKYRSIYLSALLLLGAVACGDESTLVPEVDTITDCFAPDPNATDEESVLRREFYNTEKSYLLFNDTLRHEELGIDYNGDMQYKTELLDIGYTLSSGSMSSIDYKYGYLRKMEDKRAAVTFLQEYILPHLSASLKPFSWFVTSSISYASDASTVEVAAVTGQRSVAIAVGDDIVTRNDEQLAALASSIFATYLGGRFVNNEAALEEFYAACNGLHGGNFSTADNPTQSEEINLMHCYEAGFVTQHYIRFGSFVMRTVGVYPSKEEDITSFTELIFKYTLEEIEEQYADYPKVIARARLLSDLIVDLGYIY